MDMILSKIVNWLTLEDYEVAKRQAVRGIIAKQSRGSILAQEGEIMQASELHDLSMKADAGLVRLSRAVSGS